MLGRDQLKKWISGRAQLLTKSSSGNVPSATSIKSSRGNVPSAPWNQSSNGNVPSATGNIGANCCSGIVSKVKVGSSETSARKLPAIMDVVINGQLIKTRILATGKSYMNAQLVQQLRNCIRSR